MAATPIFPPDRVTIVGVVNATPDSFSDGGRFTRGRGSSISRRRSRPLARWSAAGAHLIDVGGESTRPGAHEVPEALEIARTRPLLEALAKAVDVPLSIDTRKAAVAEAALDAGARRGQRRVGPAPRSGARRGRGARRRDADPRAPARRAGDHAARGRLRGRARRGRGRAGRCGRARARGRLPRRARRRSGHRLRQAPAPQPRAARERRRAARTARAAAAGGTVAQELSSAS